MGFNSGFKGLNVSLCSVNATRIRRHLNTEILPRGRCDAAGPASCRPDEGTVKGNIVLSRRAVGTYHPPSVFSQCETWRKDGDGGLCVPNNEKMLL